MGKPSIVALVGLFACIRASIAVDFYVAVDGSDANPGTVLHPFKSLSHARDIIRRSGKLGKEKIEVHLRGGIHYLPETFVFSAEDSGTSKFPVRYAAYRGERVILSGGTSLQLVWKPYRDGIYVANANSDFKIDQLFINGKRQHMARYPNFDPNASPYHGAAGDAFAPSRAKRWKNPRGGFIHAMHRHHWGGYHYQILSKDDNGKVAYEGGWQNNRQMGMHDQHRMVENIFEELDVPGEWYHDHQEGKLYYMPSAETDISKATVEAVRLKHLIEFRGSSDKPVKHISVSGLILRHSARTFMETREPLLRSDWTIYRGGAVLLTNAEDCQITDCEFDQLGGNSIFVNKYNRRITIKGCHLHHSGASGICFVGDPKAVRNPKFEYHQTQTYDEIDKTRGPKTEQYPADCLVDDCLIHNMSVVEKQATGVQISMSKGITVRHCSIYDLGRAGINISEGTFGAHVIEYCDVFDTVRETGDHGSFNSWGRDRFWHLKDAPAEELPQLSGLDTEPTMIRNNRWRCDHGWDVDLDDGSSHYEIYNNLFLKGGLKLREGFHRKVYNNIAVNNSLHPHVWYPNSMDIVTRNIWMGAYRPAGGMPEKKWGKEIDRNLFTNQLDKEKFAAHGCDLNSIVGDPMFIDAKNGDYRVKQGSPALKIGFRNFPMDKFGVRKPSLRKISKTPVLPELNAARISRANASPMATGDLVWLGAKLNAIDGESFSAFGVSKDQRGVAVYDVPKGSEAARIGLKQNDVITSINDKAVVDVDSFLKLVLAMGSKPLKLKMVREQKPMLMAVEQHAYLEFESADTPDQLTKLRIPKKSRGTITSFPNTNNEPLNTLIDGRLATGYGPVFSNGVRNGAYKLDLGKAMTVKAITSWSYRQNNRGAQKLTLYGSRSPVDPGWNFSSYTPIATLSVPSSDSLFTAASWRSAQNRALGEFRWIVWRVSPVTETAGGENTAYQELAIEIASKQP